MSHLNRQQSPLNNFIVLFELFCSQVSFAGSFYLQELGTPLGIGTVSAARTTNNVGTETAWDNPAGMTDRHKTTMLNNGQVLISVIEFKSF